MNNFVAFYIKMKLVVSADAGGKGSNYPFGSANIQYKL
jgi:hypothetical protein